MTFVPEQGVVTNSPLNPATVGAGRRNLLAELREFDGCDGEVSAEFVADLIAVLEGIDVAVHEAYVNAQRAVAAVEFRRTKSEEYRLGQEAMQEDAVRAIRTAAEEARA